MEVGSGDGGSSFEIKVSTEYGYSEADEYRNSRIWGQTRAGQKK